MEHQSSRAKPIRSGRLEDFVTELANVQARMVSAEVDYGPMRRIVDRFKEFFPLTFPADSALARHSEQLAESFGGMHTPFTTKEREEHSLSQFLGWSGLLRRAWDEPDHRKREWLLFRLREIFHFGVRPSARKDAPNEPPDLTPFEQAIAHLQAVLYRAKHCANPECPTPYFIAGSSRYRFCSGDCAAPSGLEAKRRWWTDKGSVKRATKSKTSGAKHAKK